MDTGCVSRQTRPQEQPTGQWLQDGRTRGLMGVGGKLEDRCVVHRHDPSKSPVDSGSSSGLRGGSRARGSGQALLLRWVVTQAERPTRRVARYSPPRDACEAYFSFNSPSLSLVPKCRPCIANSNCSFIIIGALTFAHLKRIGMLTQHSFVPS